MLPCFLIPLLFHAVPCLSSYLQARGLALEDVPTRLGLFGENSVEVEQPTFWHHLVERLTSPFVVFNLFNQAGKKLDMPVTASIKLRYIRFCFFASPVSFLCWWWHASDGAVCRSSMFEPFPSPFSEHEVFLGVLSMRLVGRPLDEIDPRC